VAEAWVLGLPLTAAGVEGEQATFVRKFARYLSYRHAAPIWLVDERMTSLAAARSSSAARTDAEAAALILSTYLSAPQLAQRAVA
jgi:putative transcription antitermination factor YqgF